MDRRFLIYAKHSRMLRWMQVKSNTVGCLLFKFGGIARHVLFHPVGLSLACFQIRCTVDLLILSTAAILRHDQWVLASAGVSDVFRTTRACRAGVTASVCCPCVVDPILRIPSRSKRPFQRATVGREVPSSASKELHSYRPQVPRSIWREIHRPQPDRLGDSENRDLRVRKQNESATTSSNCENCLCKRCSRSSSEGVCWVRR